RDECLVEFVVQHGLILDDEVVKCQFLTLVPGEMFYDAIIYDFLYLFSTAHTKRALLISS
ncbi:MAG: hypothetical protein WBO46_13360, partial [Caldilineaceae bacterium]